MNAHDCFAAGRLNDAVTAALDDVKRRPTDVDRRGLLCELLCLTGQWERADKQLETLALQAPETAVGCALFRQLIRAEVARQDLFAEGRAPELLGEAPPELQACLQATVCLRSGELADAARLAAEAEQLRPTLSGACDGESFDDFRDLDDLLGPVLELYTTTGKYFWAPWSAVESVEFYAPARPRDLLWRRASLSMRDGPDGEVFLPAIYWSTYQRQDEQLLLGRATDWSGGDESPVCGVGLRTFLIGQRDRTIMELRRLDFVPAETSS